MRNPGIIVLIAAFLLLAAIAGFFALSAFRSPVSQAKLQQVKPGMSGETVRALLGPPRHIFTATNPPGWDVFDTNAWAAQWSYERTLPLWGTTRVDVFLTNGAVSFTGGDWDP